MVDYCYTGYANMSGKFMEQVQHRAESRGGCQLQCDRTSRGYFATAQDVQSLRFEKHTVTHVSRLQLVLLSNNSSLMQLHSFRATSMLEYQSQHDILYFWNELPRLSDATAWW